MSLALIDQTQPWQWRSFSWLDSRGLAVSVNGRLWGFNFLNNQKFVLANELLPEGTNWMGVAGGSFAWTKTGELAGAMIDRLYSTNVTAAGRFALGQMIHEIRPDGTLWRIGEPQMPKHRIYIWNGPSFAPFKAMAVEPSAGPQWVSYFSSLSNKVPARLAASAKIYAYRVPTNIDTYSKTKWRQVGQRTDWVSVWASDESYFGLTANGTVWVWGTDWGQKPRVSSRAQAQHLWLTIKSKFAKPPPPKLLFANVVPALEYALVYQEEPRPLMRFAKQAQIK